MKSYLLLFYIFFLTFYSCNHQQKGLTFKEAESKGILFDDLNNIYKSPGNIDTSKAAFKNEADIEKAIIAYQNLLSDFEKFLSKNNFKWSFQTTCFQKIYFNKDGAIDYFLFNFLGEPPYEITEDQEIRFKILLNDFINDYKFPVTGNEKFTFCKTIVYGSK